MSQLESNLIKLQEAILGANFDIGKSFLPDNEIAKNIIRSKNLTLTREDADIIVDGKVKTYDISAYGPTYTPPIDYTSGTFSNTPEGLFAKSKNDTADYAKRKNIYPLKKDTMYYDEVQKLKMECRQSAMLLIRNQKSLVQDIAKASIKIANSIAGAAILIAPLSFNVPGAISMIMLVIDTISNLIEKMMATITNLEPLKKLYLLLPKSSFDAITTPINLSITILLTIFEAINALRSLIDDLSGELSSISGEDSIGSAVSYIQGQIDQKKEELKILERLVNPLFPKLGTIGSEDDKRNKRKEIADLEERIRKMRSGINLPITKNGEFSNKVYTNFLDKLNPKLEKINKGNVELKEYVYDVLLPNGEILSDLKEEDLESIKHKYTVIFNNNEL